ncbi:hypothetical protein DFJ74DRAFT_769563 [Hyaloraphidium curvatum]|nr:hypothetical protein DFJ74DRAFT_769563 [Hyaloraphidium curvatum]
MWRLFGGSSSPAPASAPAPATDNLFARAEPLLDDGETDEWVAEALGGPRSAPSGGPWNSQSGFKQPINQPRTPPKRQGVAVTALPAPPASFGGPPAPLPAPPSAPPLLHPTLSAVQPLPPAFPEPLPTVPRGAAPAGFPAAPAAARYARTTRLEARSWAVAGPAAQQPQALPAAPGSGPIMAYLANLEARAELAAGTPGGGLASSSSLGGSGAALDAAAPVSRLTAPGERTVFDLAGLSGPSGGKPTPPSSPPKKPPAPPAAPAESTYFPEFPTSPEDADDPLGVFSPPPASDPSRVKEMRPPAMQEMLAALEDHDWGMDVPEGGEVSAKERGKKPQTKSGVLKQLQDQLSREDKIAYLRLVRLLLLRSRHHPFHPTTLPPLPRSAKRRIEKARAHATSRYALYALRTQEKLALYLDLEPEERARAEAGGTSAEEVAKGLNRPVSSRRRQNTEEGSEAGKGGSEGGAGEVEERVAEGGEPVSAGGEAGTGSSESAEEPPAGPATDLLDFSDGDAAPPAGTVFVDLLGEPEDVQVEGEPAGTFEEAPPAPEQGVQADASDPFAAFAGLDSLEAKGSASPKDEGGSAEAASPADKDASPQGDADAELPTDPRHPLLSHFFLLSVADGLGYPPYARTLLRELARQLSLDSYDVVRIESGLSAQLGIFGTDDDAAEEVKLRSEADRSIAARERAERLKKWAVVGLAAVGGGAIIGLSAGVMAPLIGAGVSATLGMVGVGGTATFLSSTAGAAVIAAGGAGIGSTLSAKKMAKRTRRLATFDLLPVRPAYVAEEDAYVPLRYPSVTICVSGWLSEGEKDFHTPWSTVSPGALGELHTLRWEPSDLESLGSAFRIIAGEVISFGVQQVLGATVLHALMLGLTLPMWMLKLGYALDNPWGIGLTKAKKAGQVLADAIAAQAQGYRPVTLVGFSLGARVVFYCLLELAQRGLAELVEDAVLVGAPVMATEAEWAACASVCSGRVVNCYLPGDWVLGLLYRASTATFSKVAGLHPVGGVEGLENVDVTGLVEGHLKYRVRMPRILEKVGIKVWREWVDEEDEEEWRMAQERAKEGARAEEAAMPQPQPAGGGAGGGDRTKDPTKIWNWADIMELKRIQEQMEEYYQPRDLGASSLPPLVIPDEMLGDGDAPAAEESDEQRAAREEEERGRRQEESDRRERAGIRLAMDELSDDEEGGAPSEFTSADGESEAPRTPRTPATAGTEPALVRLEEEEGGGEDEAGTPDLDVMEAPELVISGVVEVDSDAAIVKQESPALPDQQHEDAAESQPKKGGACEWQVCCLGAAANAARVNTPLSPPLLLLRSVALLTPRRGLAGYPGTPTGRRLVNRDGTPRVCLVTGAASGIGKAAAIRFASEGGVAVVTDLKMQEGEGRKVVDECNRLNTKGKAMFALQDVTKEEDWIQIMKTIESTYGRLDVLVNNAGVFFNEGFVADEKLSDFKKVMDVNVEGVFLGTKHAIPLMNRTTGDEYRSIINLSSIAGLMGSAGPVAGYHASKGAVRLFTKATCLQLAAAKHKIRVNSVHPGVIITPLWERGFVPGEGADGTRSNIAGFGAKDLDHAKEVLSPLTPIGRTGTAEDVAEAIVFLASDESSFMTGSELVIDGGATAQ